MADTTQPWGVTGPGVQFGLDEAVRAQINPLLDEATQAAYTELVEVPADFFRDSGSEGSESLYGISVVSDRIRKATRHILPDLNALDTDRRHRLIAEGPLFTAKMQYFRLLVDGSEKLDEVKKESEHFFEPFSRVFPELAVSERLRLLARGQGSAIDMLIADRSEKFKIYGGLALRNIIAASLKSRQQMHPKAS